MSVLSLDDLRQFTGDDVRYRHSIIRKVIYTPGVRHVAVAGGAYWLIDAVAFAIGSADMKRWMAADPRVAEMQFWSLVVSSEESAVLSGVADAGEKPFFQQRIAWTDFPLARIDLWCAFDGQHWTIYLPSEH